MDKDELCDCTEDFVSYKIDYEDIHGTDIPSTYCCENCYQKVLHDLKNQVEEDKDNWLECKIFAYDHRTKYTPLSPFLTIR